jgi:hypothetical protein
VICDGILQFDSFNCSKQKSVFQFSDLTIRVMSSEATQDRYAEQLRRWLARAEDFGATVLVFAAGDIKDSLRHVQTQNDPGPSPGCALPPRTHCAALFQEHVAWMTDHVHTKYFLNVDDDTVVNLHRLAQAMRCLPADLPFVLGCCERHGLERPFCTGGAGYVMESKLLQKLKQCAVEPTTPDDVLWSTCAMDAGAVLIHHAGFQWFPAVTKLKDHWVTHHHVRTADMWKYEPL